MPDSIIWSPFYRSYKPLNIVFPKANLQRIANSDRLIVKYCFFLSAIVFSKHFENDPSFFFVLSPASHFDHFCHLFTSKGILSVTDFNSIGKPVGRRLVVCPATRSTKFYFDSHPCFSSK